MGEGAYLVGETSVGVSGRIACIEFEKAHGVRCSTQVIFCAFVALLR